MNYYCTLFDSNYLDKGIVLYKSLCRVEGNAFKLFVFAFDDLAYNILINESYPNMEVISLSEFETEALIEIKQKRSRAEYCWTCTPWTIKYVLEKYHVSQCTYLDADLMFFSSPAPMFERMDEAGASIIITPHYFSDAKKDKRTADHVGQYCVQFNTFKNDENGRKALNWWAERCMEWCYYAPYGKSEWYGDQKYLNVFPEKFDGVLVSDELGMGVAPWNAKHLKLYEENTKIKFKHSKTDKKYVLYFCHFASITFLTKRIVNAFSGMPDKKLHKAVYDSYMNYIFHERDFLEKKYSLNLYHKRKLTNNVFIAFLQKYIIPIYHIKRISDLYVSRRKS